MSLVVNNNLMAANVARNLNSHYGRLQTSTQRLSSGLRINSAADDAAGLAIRELQRADIAALHQGARNANDAISMIQVADGSLGVIDEKLIRMKELAEQAATGTYSSTQRLMIESEYQAMASEITRIANATDFNGIKLLDGTLSADKHDGSGLTSTGKMKIHFGTANDSAEDYYYITIGNCTAGALGVGNQAWKEVGSGTYSMEVFELNGQTVNKNDRYVAETNDTVFNGALDPATLYKVGTAATIDGAAPAAGTKVYEKDGKYFIIDNNALKEATVTGWTAQEKNGYAVEAAIPNPARPGTPREYYKPEYVTSANKAVAKNDVQNVTSSTVKVTKTTDYYNAAGAIVTPGGDIYEVGTASVDDGTGTMKNTTVYLKDGQYYKQDNATPPNIDTANPIAAADIDVATWGPKTTNGYPTLATATDPGKNEFYQPEYVDDDGKPLTKAQAVTVTENKSIQYSDGYTVSTQEAAQKALNAINLAIESKDKIRAHLGAMQNRLENTVTNLNVQAENLQAAESRISDVDVATEMTQFVRNQILTQSAVAMLGQANSLPQMAMQLIGG